MFYFISGKLAHLEPGLAVVEAGGVGYGMVISGTTYSALPHGETEQSVKLFTHMSVREDGIELFGFATLEELNIFKMLISVSGIGPKAATSLLGCLSPEKLAVAICSDDKKALSKAPGIGAKTAARIVLELKDKLHAAPNAVDEPDAAPAEPSLSSEALDALMVLGFNRAAAAEALRGTDPDAELEDVIRDALKKLMK